MNGLISRAALFEALAGKWEKDEVYAALQAAPEVEAEPVRRWHFVAEDEEDLPENGQWCAVMYMSPISRFPRGTVARWYDGNIVTAWHEWFRELMPEACWYEPIVNGGVAKISGVGMKCVIAWMPIEMDERVYGGPGDNE